MIGGRDRQRSSKSRPKCWENNVGRMDDAICPRCGEADDIPDHVVFRCMKIRRIKESELGRTTEGGLAGMSWHRRSG